MKTNVSIGSILLVLGISAAAEAHSGRRMEILIIDNQLFTQGYVSGTNPTDDGGGLVRPYYNALHDHWGNLGPVAVADLPGFDLHNPAGLLGYDLTLALTGAGKWFDPMNNVHGGHGGHGGSGGHGGHGGTPVLAPLDPAETISIGYGTQATIDTDSLGSFVLADNIAGPVLDIDLQYSIMLNPENTVYFLEWQLATAAPGIAASEPIYTILSPDRNSTNPLHHSALALERHLGIAIPEPTGAGFLAVASLLVTRRRRR